MKIFESRRVKGAVSIFLVIITIPTMLLAAVLIDGSRMSSARAMTQEATDLAAASVLTDYNQLLKDEFGLLALNESDEGKLKSAFEESLSATLLSSGMSQDSAYSERLWEVMKTTVTGQKSYMGASFLNLYDFRVDECTVKPLYALANQAVLENQMIEYAKFRGLYVMADRFDILNSLGNAKAEAEKNEVTSEVMLNKMGVDEANAAADRALSALRTEMGTLNTAVRTAEEAKKQYLEVLKIKMEEMRIENTETEDELSREQEKIVRQYESMRNALKSAAESACRQAGTVLSQAEKAKTEVENAIARLEAFQTGNQGKAADNESVEEMISDANSNIEFYRTDYLPNIRKILEDSTLNQMKQDTGIRSDLDGIMDDIQAAITKYTDIIDEMKKEARENEEEEPEITEYEYFYLNSTESTTESDAVMNGRGAGKSYQPSIDRELSYFIGKEWDPETVNPSKIYKNTTAKGIDSDFAKSQSGKTGNADTSLEGEAERGTVEDAVYQARPSKTWTADEEPEINTDFYQEDGDLSASQGMLEQGKHSSILDIGEVARDDVLCLSYIFGTFKTRLTGVKKFSSEGMSESDKESFYMPKWRYAHPEGELDMRFTPKKERDTVLRAEIEYLIYGNQSDAANEGAVYATIFAERLVNNVAAMYADKEVVNPSCHAAAAIACALSMGVVPEPVFFWGFLAIWASSETFIEMDYLISGGYRVPLFKTPKNLLLNEFPDMEKDGLISNYGETGIFVSYEDYLLIFLLVAGREKRIMRTADLIEMNMKKNGDSDFTMANAFTYLHADTNLSIRYLFGSTAPFQESYEEKGYTGRMKFTNTIYQGY